MPTKQTHRCFECGRNFPRGWNLKRHYEDVHHYPKIQNMESDHYVKMSIENYRNKKEAKKVSSTTDFYVKNSNIFRKDNAVFSNGLTDQYMDIDSFTNNSSSENDYQKFFITPDSAQAREDYQKEREKVSYPLLLLRINQRISFLNQYVIKNKYRVSLSLYYLRCYCILGNSTEPIDNLLKNLGLYGEFQRRFLFYK